MTTVTIHLYLSKSKYINFTMQFNYLHAGYFSCFHCRLLTFFSKLTVSKTYFNNTIVLKSVISHHILSTIGAPQGFWGSGENGYLFAGSWGALVIILGS